MNETYTPPKHLDSEFVPVDGNEAVREFLDLDNAEKAKSSLDTLHAFTNDLESSAGTSSADGNLKRERMRHEQATGRRPLNVARKALIGAGIAAGALAYGLIGGQDMKHEQKLAEYDEKNKQLNIANNPELFDQLPENSQDMTVEADRHSDPGVQLSSK